MTAPPLTSPEVDLRDFPYMPLDVVRLRDSETAIMTTGDGFRAAVLLWCAAWHQVPAASLPNDDRALAHLAGFGRDLVSWREVRDDALRGFVECSDGRLYHATIAEKAKEAWEAKLQRRKRTEAARAARYAADKSQGSDKPATREATISVTEIATQPVASSKGREGKGRESSSLRSEDDLCPNPPASDLSRLEELEAEAKASEVPSPAKKRRERTYTPEFEAFWSAYPTDPLMSKSETFKAWEKLPPEDHAKAMEGVPGLREHCRRNPTYRCVHAVRYLSQRRFDGFSDVKDASGAPLPRTVKIDRDTPQGKAWDAHAKAEGRRIPWTDSVWHFPSEWPPGAGPPAKAAPDRAA